MLKEVSIKHLMHYSTRKRDKLDDQEKILSKIGPLKLHFKESESLTPGQFRTPTTCEMADNKWDALFVDHSKKHLAECLNGYQVHFIATDQESTNGATKNIRKYEIFTLQESPEMRPMCQSYYYTTQQLKLKRKVSCPSDHPVQFWQILNGK